MKNRLGEEKVKRIDAKKITVLSMLAAFAYIASVLIRIPCGSFLTYDMKDVLLAVGGFLYGPIAVMPAVLAVCFMEMITVGGTGIIGALMSFVSSAGFVFVAALIYQYHRKLSGAIAGLLAGAFVSALFMLLWNVFLTPLYLGIPQVAVKELLFPVIFPFNILKNLVNGGVVMLIYKPLSKTLNRLGMKEGG